jgi:hypothetical protein
MVKMDPHSDDPLRDAERQMAEHETALISTLFGRLSARLGLAAAVDREELVTEAEIRAAFEQLVSEDPETLELVQRLAVLQRFREPPSGGLS